MRRLEDSKDPSRFTRLIEILKILGSKLRESMTEGIKKAMHQAMDALKTSVVEMQWFEYVRNLLKDDFERGQKLLADIMNLIRENAAILKRTHDIAAEFGKEFWSDLKSVADRLMDTLQKGLEMLEGRLEKFQQEFLQADQRLHEHALAFVSDARRVYEAYNVEALVSAEDNSIFDRSSSELHDYLEQRETLDQPTPVEDDENAVGNAETVVGVFEKAHEVLAKSDEGKAEKLQKEIDKLHDVLSELKQELRAKKAAKLGIDDTKEKIERVNSQLKEMRKSRNVIVKETNTQEAQLSRKESYEEPPRP